jgi:hypothetical protein
LVIAVHAAPLFRPVQLPHGVTFQLPRNWQTISDNTRTTLDAAVETLSRTDDLATDLAFAANCYDDAGQTIGIFNVRYHPDMTVMQRQVAAATAADIAAFDQELRSSLSQSMPKAGMGITQWKGTKLETIAGRLVLVTDYQRISLSRGTSFRVRLVRAFNGPASFTMTVSYREDASVFLAPISDRIIQSLQF